MKTINKIEIGLAILGLISFGLFLANLPMSSTLIVLFFGTLSIFYMWGSYFIFKTPSEKSNTPRAFGSILIGLSIAVSLIGIQFKLMRWPGANMQITLGIYSLLIPLLICIIKFFSSKSKFYANILARIVPLLAIGFTLLYMPTYTLLEIQYSNYPDLVEAIKASNADPDNQELLEKQMEEFEKMRLEE